MVNKVKNVTPLANATLIVEFEGGVSKLYDVKPLIENGAEFAELGYTNGLFEMAGVDADGFGVSWNGHLSLDCDELWHGGKVI